MFSAFLFIIACKFSPSVIYKETPFFAAYDFLSPYQCYHIGNTRDELYSLHEAPWLFIFSLVCKSYFRVHWFDNPSQLFLFILCFLCVHICVLLSKSCS